MKVSNMPDYDYNCRDCSGNFTFSKSMTDSTIPDCPKCGSSNVSRIWGGFQLKGCCRDSGSKASGGGCGGCTGGSCSTCH